MKLGAWGLTSAVATATSCGQELGPGIYRAMRLRANALKSLAASWQSGDAPDCKSVYSGSIPDEASISFMRNC